MRISSADPLRHAPRASAVKSGWAEVAAAMEAQDADSGRESNDSRARAERRRNKGEKGERSGRRERPAVRMESKVRETARAGQSRKDIDKATTVP